MKLTTHDFAATLKPNTKLRKTKLHVKRVIDIDPEPIVEASEHVESDDSSLIDDGPKVNFTLNFTYLLCFALN